MNRRERYICAWLEFSEGLIQILSFTLIKHPAWSFRYVMYISRKAAKKKMESLK